MSNDPVEMLICHQATVLLRLGRPVDQVRAEAEEIIASLLGDMIRLGCAGVPIDRLFRQAQAYRLRNQSITVEIISERLSVSIATVKRDIASELKRRRVAAQRLTA